MAEDILTIEDVAKYLRVSERTVYDWAQKGEIPAGKIGTVWRFKKDSVERWVNERLSGSKKARQPALIRAEEVITPGRIVFLDSQNRDEALMSLADKLCAEPQIQNHDELRQAMLQREKVIRAAIGCGIAISAARLDSVSDLVVSAGISRAPISGFLPLDGEPVRILIMVAAAYTQHTYYLHTISFFGARLKNNKLRNAIIASKDETEACKLLVGCLD